MCRSRATVRLRAGVQPGRRQPKHRGWAGLLRSSMRDCQPDCPLQASSTSFSNAVRDAPGNTASTSRELSAPHPPTHPTHTPGVPVIWHDNYVVYGEEACPTSSLVAELSLEEFRQLAPINAGAAGAAGSYGGDTPLLGSSPTASTASLGSLASLDTACTASSASSRRLLRKHRNGEPAMPHEPTLRAWACEQEDQFPLLAEVGGVAVSWGTSVKVSVAPASEGWGHGCGAHGYAGKVLGGAAFRACCAATCGEGEQACFPGGSGTSGAGQRDN